MDGGFTAAPAPEKVKTCPTHNIPLQKRPVSKSYAGFVRNAAYDRGEWHCPKCAEGGDTRARQPSTDP